MKNLNYLFVFLFAVGLTACNDDDGYSLDTFVLSTATYHSIDGYFYLENDNGTTLWPASSYVRPGSFEDGERVVVNYTPLGEDPNGVYDYYVKVNNMDDLLTKDMLTFDESTTQAEIDSVGYDPIHIVDAWMKDQYLTVQFELPGTFGIHMLNLVYDKTSDANLTDAGFVVLDLKQNDYDMSFSGFTGWGLVSFDVTDLQTYSNDGSTVSIVLKSDSGYGEETYEETLVYNFETGTVTKQSRAITESESAMQALK